MMQALVNDVGSVDVWEVAGIIDHGGSGVIGQFAAEGLVGEDVADLWRQPDGFGGAGTDTDDGEIGVD